MEAEFSQKRINHIFHYTKSFDSLIGVLQKGFSPAIDLSNHNLSAIPDSIFSLTKLEYLQLGNNGWTSYPQLSALSADKGSGDSLNKITEIRSDIENLQALRLLGVCYNDLQALPKEITKLEKLDTLDLSFNEHLSISLAFETLKQMHWLKYLNIVATLADHTTIDRLRKALPKTKIDARLEDLTSE